jgi:predicted amidohydrolase YtcJ
VLGSFDTATRDAMALAGLEAYTQFGFTTAQEGRSDTATAENWRMLAEANRLPIDVAVYPDIQTSAEYLRQTGVSAIYRQHFRIAGAKLSLDGSPQGKTAWLTKPYVVPPPGKPADYAGYPAIPDPAERQRLVDLAFANHWQLLVHCNGDAASDAMITAVRAAEAKYGKDDRRPVMIHAQAVRLDQLAPMRDLGIVPSYFSMHTYYWGDWHREQTLGPERAAHISPTASTLKLGMRFTEHHDAPVALPSALVIVHTTVNRSSRSGVVIGPEERVSPFIALKAITEWAAWQYFEENSKGTLTPGKLADLVILDRNPLEVEPATIRDIRVLETIKEGRSVYTAH